MSKIFRCALEDNGNFVLPSIILSLYQHISPLKCLSTVFWGFFCFFCFFVFFFFNAILSAHKIRQLQSLVSTIICN